eukprot:m.182762 g.182762  ORF g.182762 m.182762 type:complete len:142 (+) comp18470_c0_seq3:665-1090(+)
MHHTSSEDDAKTSTYPQGSRHTTFMLILNKYCSVSVSSAAFVALAWLHNEAMVSLVVGSLANAAVGKMMKRMIGAARPSESQRSSKGMPSSHANSLSFFATSLSLRMLTTPLGSPSHTPSGGRHRIGGSLCMCERVQISSV